MYLTFGILLFYYNRPVLVRNALQSLQETSYQHWELIFIDDSLETLPGKPIVEEYFGNDKRIKYYCTNDTMEERHKRGTSIFGKTANQGINESNADIMLMLCDDDALYPTYLEGLNRFYLANSDIKYSYSHIILFDPTKEDYHNATMIPTFHNNLKAINPVCNVDSSQVSWRLKETRDVQFPENKTIALDAVVFGQLFQKFGNCIFNGLIGQYKGWFDGQLGKREIAKYWDYQG